MGKWLALHNIYYTTNLENKKKSFTPCSYVITLSYNTSIGLVQTFEPANESNGLNPRD